MFSRCVACCLLPTETCAAPHQSMPLRQTEACVVPRRSSRSPGAPAGTPCVITLLHNTQLRAHRRVPWRDDMSIESKAGDSRSPFNRSQRATHQAESDRPLSRSGDQFLCCLKRPTSPAGKFCAATSVGTTWFQ